MSREFTLQYKTKSTNTQLLHLTLWEPAYDIFVLRFAPKK